MAFSSRGGEEQRGIQLKQVRLRRAERDYDELKRCIWDEVLPLPRDGGNQAPHYTRMGFHLGGQYNSTSRLGGVS